MRMLTTMDRILKKCFCYVNSADLKSSNCLTVIMSDEGVGLLAPQNDEECCVCCVCEYDSRYFRTAEGVLRILSIALAAAGMVFVVASSFRSVGTFFFIVATIFITYSFFVIVMETCMPNVYIHRLIDTLVLLGSSGFLLFAAGLNTIYGIKKHEGHLGVAAISGYVCSLVCIILAVIVFRKFKGQGNHRYDD